MADSLKKLTDYPDVDFIGGYTLEKCEQGILDRYHEKRAQLEGGDQQLPLADHRRLILETCSYYFFLALKVVEFNARQNSIKDASGDYLERLGIGKHVSRRDAAGASVTMRYSMSSARAAATPIAAGSRVTAGDNVYFATNEYAEIPAGETFVDVSATCLTPGRNGNAYSVGEIDTMVDIVAFIDSVSNTTAPENGRDKESDDDLRERIYAAPDGFTTGGTTGAYEYLVRAFDSTVEDVLVVSPSPRVVHITVLLTGGAIPGEEYLKELQNFISDKTKKMLTDKIETAAPTTKTYAIDLTYYINSSDKIKATTIQKEVSMAIEDYKLWQRSKIGRDLNPDELTKRILAAGAKRVEYRRPVFEKIGEDAVAIPGTVNVVYGGMEND